MDVPLRALDVLVVEWWKEIGHNLDHTSSLDFAGRIGLRCNGLGN